MMTSLCLKVLLIYLQILKGFSSTLKSSPELITAIAQERNVLRDITPEEWNEFIKFGIQSMNQEKSLERNLLKNEVTVKNDTLSHIQLLDTMPNVKAQQDALVAQKILSSSLYVYNSVCAPQHISGEHCEAMLREIPLPDTSELARECKEIVQNYQHHEHHHFRRLLPRHYKDGFYRMFDNLPNALHISQQIHDHQQVKRVDKSYRNLALVQWAQFIEQDLSKPVVASMSDGSTIECCDTNNFNLLPRYRHPLCAPLFFKNHTDRHGHKKCLSYVRSGLSVGHNCTFAGRDQFNQATANLDLSQLYGITDDERKRVRSFNNGSLMSSDQNAGALLTSVNREIFKFCTDNENRSSCFLAGDSRVNNNPFTITIYTLFLRNHNRLARFLSVKYPAWNDETLFQTARSLNIHTYQNIVFEEWLPEVLGHSLAYNITKQLKTLNDAPKISNEFGIAAVRFYQSMLPDELELKKDSSTQVISLPREIYKPSFQYTQQFDEVLWALLNQAAMSMDVIYENSLRSDIVSGHTATRLDALAFDIQRNRDHGLQPYVKYLEMCENIEISKWQDLAKYIPQEILNRLQSIYSSFKDLDLIIGGMSEKSVTSAVIGPTFQCIFAEQFSKLHRHPTKDDIDELLQMHEYLNMKSFDFLCNNAKLSQIPTNIFHVPSDQNPLRDCFIYEGYVKFL